MKATYPTYFDDPEKHIVEFGSLNINGTVRDYFSSTHYVGVDWRLGPCVDIVSLAHDAPFAPESFDVVISASMLEHDLHWQKSLAKMVNVLHPTGLLALSWGGGRNDEHCSESAPDGKFHSLKARKVLRELDDLGLYVHFFQYERADGYADMPITDPRILYYVGELTLIGFKDRNGAAGQPWLDPVMPWDEA